MKKEKITAIAFYIAAVGFYITAIAKFLVHDDTSMGIVWLFLGSTMLCLGSVWLNKTKKSNQSDEEE